MSLVTIAAHSEPMAGFELRLRDRLESGAVLNRGLSGMYPALRKICLYSFFNLFYRLKMDFLCLGQRLVIGLQLKSS